MKIHAKRPEEDDGPVITEAWCKAGLAIHLTKRGYARLSHIPTGKSIYTFDTPDIAAECGDELVRLTDWNSVGEQKAGSELYKQVRPVIDRICARYEDDEGWS